MMRIRSTRPLLAGAVLCLVVAGALPAAAQDQPAAAGDQPAAGVPVLTLSQCVNIALGSSPTLGISDEQRDSAAQDVKSAWGAFLPDISLSRTWQRSDRTDFDVQQYTTVVDSVYVVTPPPVPGDPTGVALFQIPDQVLAGKADQSITTKYKSWDGSASLNLFQGFGKFANLSAAKRSLAAAEANRDYTRELVVQDVVMAYYNLLRAEELLKVAKETRDQTAKELEKTETYFRLGSAAKSDVLQQRVQLENTRLDVVVADNSVKKAFADLAYAMNRPLAATFAVDASELDTDFFVPEMDALYQEALQQRLDLQGNEYEVEAAHKNVVSATSGLWPRVDVSLRYSRYNNESPYRFGAQESQSTSYGASVTWNVFDRMQTWASRGKAKANARIAEYQLDQARLNVQVEVRQLHNALVEARERAKVSRETIDQAEEELRLAQERFRVGAGTTLDIIVAQANLANARGQEVQAKCDFLIAQAQMRRATGQLSPWTGSR